MDPSQALAAAGELQQGMATRRQLLAAGLSSRALREAVDAARLVRVRRGLYAAAALEACGPHLLSGGRIDPAYVRQVRAALLPLGAGPVVSRRTAAVLWGFDMMEEPDAIELDVPVTCRGKAIEGADVQRRDVPAVDMIVSKGDETLRVASAVATVVCCALTRPTMEAVAVADSALRTGRVSVADLREAQRGRRGMPGLTALSRTVRLADPRCGSVLESMLRVLLCQHGLAPPSTQHVIQRGDGSFVGRVDFAWPDRRLVVEADGRRWHDPADARDADRRRANDLELLGWGLLRFTWADVVHRPEYVVETVRAALARRAVA
jgi:very-short-patch-repair endonuclease